MRKVAVNEPESPVFVDFQISQRTGAGDGDRTHDIQLGKLVHNVLKSPFLSTFLKNLCVFLWHYAATRVTLS
jgi:hypothetical protein